MKRSLFDSMKWASACFISCAAMLVASRAGAAPANRGGGFSLTPHIGVGFESEYVEGPVQFSNGDVDFISIDPETGLLLGLKLAYRFGDRLSAFLTLSYASADADYVERDNVRPEVELNTIRIQPGVLFDVATFGSSTVSVGGGLTLAFLSVDRLVWQDRAVQPDTTSLGLLGIAALDVGLTERLSFHSHLALEISKPFLGDLEGKIALAEGESGADIDAETRTALMLGVGLNIMF